MVNITKYNKSYNGKPVLVIEQLNIDGGFTWLKGENGSGKSTFLRSIAGIIPYEGNISIAGTEDKPGNRKRYRELVNYAEANPQYPEFLRGKDMVALFSKVKSTNADAISKIAGQLGIGKFLDDKIGGYSSGMIKKLSLLLAFTGNPTVILLDEPLATLDTEACNQVHRIMEEYKEKNTCFIFTSHQNMVFSNGGGVNVLQIKNGEIIKSA